MDPGNTVGYGGGYVARRPIRIAVVDAGYAQGLGLERSYATSDRGRLRSALGQLRRVAHQTPLAAVTAQGQQLRVLGRVGMCDTVLEVTGTQIRVGDRVELPVNPIYVDARVPRVYV